MAKTRIKRTRFSVLLHYPDYLCEGGNIDTYMWSGTAINRDHAVQIAQKAATRVQNTDYETTIDPEDFAEALVVRGHVRCA